MEKKHKSMRGWELRINSQGFREYWKGNIVIKQRHTVNGVAMPLWEMYQGREIIAYAETRETLRRKANELLKENS